MRAIQAMRAGGPEVLEVADVPEAPPGPGTVLVAVAAAGVNFIDTYRRSGTYPMPYPHVVGSEGAGTVVAVGAGVEGFAVGDRVAWVDGTAGSYAEQVELAARHAVPVPHGVTLQQAAAVMLQGLTAHYLVDSTFPVTAGQRVLVHAGAGGVGLLLTQLAVARGAVVVSTVSTEEKAALSRGAGATHVIRYDQLADLAEELPALVREHVGGVETVFDGVGAATFDASLASLVPRGGLALFGGASGQVDPVDPQRLARAGSVFLTRPTLAHHVATRAELLHRTAAVFDAMLRGSLEVRVGATFPLAEAAEAHRLLEGRGSTGKILLLP
ncbi:quinone oxidoreductase [Actinotalea sp. BY-33]|uniref:Quinone oxidoreductase n=1 Tax=Actinotalea soli TaxID=2819234 RepID=A0A939LXU2_9CELL|nr:quinone oxidoreductase [Actinotalea soli]MBO1753227.1 quinone oxidoreductase [Actinotalea soli]